MIIIGVDGNEANIKDKVGVNVYAFELLCSIYKLQDEWKGRYKFVIYLQDQPRKDLPKETESWEYKVKPGRGLWVITRLMPELFFGKPQPDVFWTPSHYLPPFSPMPKMCSIMDLGYLKFSAQFKKYDFWQLKLWTAWSLLVSKRVIAISESTLKDIVRHYPFSVRKIRVTQLGYDRGKFNLNISERNVRLIKKKYSLKHYVLFLSTLKPSKNVVGLVEAWVKILNKYPNFKLVIGGKKGWMYAKIFESVKKLSLEDKIIFTGFVPEAEKPALIKGAAVFIMPSFWEGFGIDVLSAMACGVPVVVSNQGSLPEVVGKSGIVVDPYDVTSMATGLDKVLSMSTSEYNKLVKKQLAHAENFSWEKTARKTLEVLEELTK